MRANSSRFFRSAFKNWSAHSDNSIMARRVTCQWMACVLVLAIGGWHGTFRGTCVASDVLFLETDAEEDQPDMSRVKAQAEAGRAKSQTQLADFYLAASDFTNAVYWYRRAADQQHVPAQLSLAGCLMLGHGTARNPAEAARMLRLAADTIEFSSSTGKLARSALTSKAQPEQGAKAVPMSLRPADGVPGASSNTPAASVATIISLPAATLTNLGRAQRVDALLAAEPSLQESRPSAIPAPAPR